MQVLLATRWIVCSQVKDLKIGTWECGGMVLVVLRGLRYTAPRLWRCLNPASELSNARVQSSRQSGAVHGLLESRPTKFSLVNIVSCKVSVDFSGLG